MSMMIGKSISNHQRVRRIGGSGLINKLINKLPFELHIPGYNFCGPGTKLQKRLDRGDNGVNGLDEACKEHDIAYSVSDDLNHRHKADHQLYEKAVARIKSNNARFGEKLAASTVAALMKAKTKFGMGVSEKRRRPKHRLKVGGALSFTQAMRVARKAISRGGKRRSLLSNVKIAYANLKKKKVISPRKRIIPIPKTGGFLPLIPLFAALGALGSLGGGAAAIAKSVNDAKAAKEKLEEDKRHNRALEAQKISGSGYYIKPYKAGCGLYLSSNAKN